MTTDLPDLSIIGHHDRPATVGRQLAISVAQIGRQLTQLRRFCRRLLRHLLRGAADVLDALHHPGLVVDETQIAVRSVVEMREKTGFTLKVDGNLTNHPATYQ